MGLPDQLTVARAASVPVVVLLFELDFRVTSIGRRCYSPLPWRRDWFDGRIARRRGHTSPLGSLLDPIADKIVSPPEATGTTMLHGGRCSSRSR